MLNQWLNSKKKKIWHYDKRYYISHEIRASVVRGSIFWWKRASNFFHIGNVGDCIHEILVENSIGSNDMLQREIHLKSFISQLINILKNQKFKVKSFR